MPFEPDPSFCVDKLLEAHAALCRVAALKALPTDEEVAAAGFAHAGGLLIHLRENDPPGYKRLVAERATPWGRAPCQPLARCVDHLISYVLHVIELATRGDDDLELTDKECQQFFGAGGGGDKKKA